jgi:hypothetical protein
VRLLGLRAAPSAPAHRYLLLSSAVPGGGPASTTVLEVGGEGLRPAHLPGLQAQAATLLAAPLPGGHMAQVTPQVRGGGG